MATDKTIDPMQALLTGAITAFVHLDCPKFMKIVKVSALTPITHEIIR